MDELLQLGHWAAHKRDEPALLAPDTEALTYGALLPLLQQSRQRFRHAGVPDGELVAHVMFPGLAAMVICLALAEESTCTPLDPSLTQQEYLGYLKQLRASTLVIQDGGPQAAVAAAHELGLLVLQASLIMSDEPELDVRVVHARTTGVAGRQVGAPLLLFTSSTTGDAKLVPVSEANLVARLESDERALGLGPEDRLLTVMPAFHAFGLQRSLAQLRCGGSVVLTVGFDNAQFGEWWRTFRPTWLAAGVPGLHALAASTEQAKEIFATYGPRFVLVGGGTPEARVSAVVEQMFGAPVMVGYGSSESGPITRGKVGSLKPGSVGAACGPEIRIAEGEILLRGPGVIAAYVDDAAANREAFRDGWYCTGDLGFLDQDGFLFITGRLKEIISRGSEKIWPLEIDRVLISHPGVQDAATFPIPHPTLGDEVAAVVVLREGAQVTDVDLRRYAATRLAAFKIPRLLVFVDSIPRTASGKLKRSALTEQYREMPAPALEGPLLREEEQHTASLLMDIWSRTLGKSVTLADQDFSQLGGDSLSAARMLAEVDRVFHAGGQVMKRADFFDEPTVRTLIRIVSECQPTAAAAASGILTLRGNTLDEDGASNAVPVFFFPGWRGHQGGPVDPYYLRHLAAHMGDCLHIVTASIPDPEVARPVEELARESITAIRGIQARGPYVLAGHCLGAVVAFDVARQLMAKGDAVSRIVFYDAVAPGYPKLGISPTKVIAEVVRIVRHLDWREAWSHVDSFARLLNQRFSGRSNRTTESRLTNNFRGIALWQYQPVPCPIPIVHFLAADHPVSRVVDDPRYGWREFAPSGIEFEAVPGDHDSMFHKEHAAGLAHRLLKR